MATRHPHTGTPSRLHSLIEWRALAEMAVLPFTWPALAQLPHGDGHPVLLLPGFMADEGSLFALKAFLAGRGYAVEIGENEDGLMCIGVPILDRAGYPVAAISLSAPERRMKRERTDAAAVALKVAAERISMHLSSASRSP